MNLDYPYSGDVTKPVYTVEVDVPSLQAAVGAAVVLHGYDERDDPGNPGNPIGYRETRELRVDVEDPLVLKTAYDDTEDELRLTVSLDGGTAGQVVTSTGPNSNPVYADVPTELPTGATDRQVLTWDATASPEAPAWEDPTGGGATSIRTEVTVTTSQIRTLDTTLVDLIAAPGAGKYLMIEQAWIVKSGTEAAVETPACPGASPRTPTAGCIANASISVIFVDTQVTPNQPFHIYTDSIYRVFLSGFYNADDLLSDEEYIYGEEIGGHALYADTALQLGVWYNFQLSDNWSEAAWDAFTASLTSATSFKFVIFYQVHDSPDLS